MKLPDFQEVPFIFKAASAAAAGGSAYALGLDVSAMFSVILGLNVMILSGMMDHRGRIARLEESER